MDSMGHQLVSLPTCPLSRIRSCPGPLVALSSSLFPSSILPVWALSCQFLPAALYPVPFLTGCEKWVDSALTQLVSFCPWLKGLERSCFYLIGPPPCPVTLESCSLAGLFLIQPQHPQSLMTWLKLQLLIFLKPLKPGFVILEAICVLRFKMKC